MIKVQNINLSEIIPHALKQDKTIGAICKVLQKYIDENFNLINKLIILPNIENLEEDILDHIAYQFHVDFYDAELPLEVKQQLVRSSMKWHRIKGTRASLEQMLETIYYDIRVEEWFEYEDNFILDGSWLLDGTNQLDYNTVKKPPYYFRVILNSLLENNIDTSSIGKIIKASKNTRSWLDVILFFLRGKVETKETYNMPAITHRVFCPFNIEGLALNGKWNLDGTYFLDNIHEPIIVKLINRFLMNELSKETFDKAILKIKSSIKNVDKSSSSRNFITIGLNFWQRKQVFLNGRWDINGEHLLDSYEINKKKPLILRVNNNLKLKTFNTFESNKIIVEKNLWLLDGKNTLGDGSLLNAEIIKEEI